MRISGIITRYPLFSLVNLVTERRVFLRMIINTVRRFSCCFVVLLTICSSMLLSGCNLQSSSENAFSVSIGDTIPDFSLQDLDGNTVSTESLLGKPYVVAVFATWCPPCKMELTMLESDVWQKLKDQGIKVIGINFGEEDATMIAKFASQNGLTFPLLIDEDGDFRRTVGISMIPQSIVVGSDGKILDLHVGFTDESVASTAATLQDAL